MSRRVPSEGEQFGSDSFLDIIANIVGILIILIMMSGLRVSRAPVPRAEESAQMAAAMPAPAADAPEELSAPESPKSLAPAEPSPELLGRIEKLEAERTRLLATQTAVDDEGRAADNTRAALESRLGNVRRALEGAIAELRQTGAGMQRLAEEIDRRRTIAERLHVELAQAESEASPVRELKHRVTPISRTVRGKELHFRLANNRVSPIPLDELIERVKSQIDRQKDWLAKFNRHEGEVGPVDGFSLSYVIQRQDLSTFDRIRAGQQLVRVAVTHWELKPQPGVRSESAMEALRSDSAFRRALLLAEPDATLTFWVYPDSFELYRKLQEVAHAEGFTVAGRPLPFGVPIAGSPQGSHSAAQ